MRKVVNTANQAVIAVIDGKTYRFNAREMKILEATVVDHPDFQMYSTLRVVGTYVPPYTPPIVGEVVEQPQEDKLTVVYEPIGETSIEAEGLPQEEEINEVNKVDIVTKKKRKSTRK